MSGILELLAANVQANTDALNRIAAAMAQGGSFAGNASNAAAPATDAQTSLGPLGNIGQLAAGPAPAVQPPPANVTAEMITALIQPHIANDAIKAALGAAMRGMGINALPETQPHQFVPLYQAFQQVIAQHTAGGAGAGSASII